MTEWNRRSSSRIHTYLFGKLREKRYPWQDLSLKMRHWENSLKRLRWINRNQLGINTAETAISRTGLNLKFKPKFRQKTRHILFGDFSFGFFGHCASTLLERLRDLGGSASANVCIILGQLCLCLETTFQPHDLVGPEICQYIFDRRCHVGSTFCDAHGLDSNFHCCPQLRNESCTSGWIFRLITFPHWIKHGARRLLCIATFDLSLSPSQKFCVIWIEPRSNTKTSSTDCAIGAGGVLNDSQGSHSACLLSPIYLALFLFS